MKQKLFNTIAIEIAASCNRRCKFCPVSVAPRPDELMPTNVYDAIIGELSALQYSGRIEFYIYNEPMRHRANLELCVAKARSLTKAILMVSTNGDYMRSVDDLAWLYRIGVHQVVLNAYAQGRYATFMQWKQQYEAQHGALLTDAYTKIPYGKKALRVYDKESPSAFGDGVFALQNRAGLIPDFLPPTTEPVSRMCVKPFRLMNINWRGEGMICCNDYYADVPVGRIGKESVLDMWHGSIMSAYRASLLKKDRSLPLCRSCDCHSGAYPAAIDHGLVRDPASSQHIEGIYAARLEGRNASVCNTIVPETRVMLTTHGSDTSPPESA